MDSLIFPSGPEFELFCKSREKNPIGHTYVGDDGVERDSVMPMEVQFLIRKYPDQRNLIMAEWNHEKPTSESDDAVDGNNNNNNNMEVEKENTAPIPVRNIIRIDLVDDSDEEEEEENKKAAAHNEIVINLDDSDEDSMEIDTPNIAVAVVVADEGGEVESSEEFSDTLSIDMLEHHDDDAMDVDANGEDDEEEKGEEEESDELFQPQQPPQPQYPPNPMAVNAQPLAANNHATRTHFLANAGRAPSAAEHFYMQLLTNRDTFFRQPLEALQQLSVYNQAIRVQKAKAALKFLFQCSLGYVRNPQRSRYLCGLVYKLRTLAEVHAFLADAINNFHTVFESDLVNMMRN